MVAYTTLISATDLAQHLDDQTWLIVDCRFSLADTERGRRDYRESHIPGAIYAHLNEDLSGPVVTGRTGRHPLPDPDAFARTLGGWGVGDDIQVVAYDDSTGGIAARLWWMLRWLGHDAVAVLDGGWLYWSKNGLPAQGGAESPTKRIFTARPRAHFVVDTAVVEAMLESRPAMLFDSRAADRYRGENETIDPVAGHIPGAISVPYEDNVGPDGLFLPKEILKDRFEVLMAGIPSEQAAFYCGSGVTAAQNLLAMAHAGLGNGRLYAGSWSEWIADPTRPIVQ